MNEVEETTYVVHQKLLRYPQGGEECYVHHQISKCDIFITPSHDQFRGQIMKMSLFASLAFSINFILDYKLDL